MEAGTGTAETTEPGAPRAWTALAVAVLLVAIWWLDWVTGHELRLFLLYFLPVSLAGWFLGRTAGLLVAALSAVAWIAADHLSGHEYVEPLHQVANGLVQLATFSFVALLLARTSAGLRTERALTRRVLQEKERVERLNELTERDLVLAEKVQRAILPPERPAVPGLDVVLTYRPAIRIGGDLLALHRLDDDRTLFFLGDVMGHGVHAALIMSAVSVAVRRLAAGRPEPSALLAELNATLLTSFPDQLVTAACCLVETDRSAATVAVAGHPPPLRIRKELAPEAVPVRGPVLGMLAEARYDQRQVRLRPGDGLVLYTDGLTEAGNGRGDLYGEERLVAALSAAAGGTAQRVTDDVLADVDGFRERTPFQDDVALLVVRVP